MLFKWIKIVAKCLTGCETGEGLHFDYYLFNGGEHDETPFSYEAECLSRRSFCGLLYLPR